MKRILFLTTFLGSFFCSDIFCTTKLNSGPLIATPVGDNDDLFIKVYIQRIYSGVKECSLNGIQLPTDKFVKPVRLIQIPFISICNYMRQYTSDTPVAYAPEKALKIKTPYGQFRLWASESGVMCLKDPDESQVSLDGWKAKKLLGITRAEHGGKSLYKAALVLKVIKENKFKMVLEPVN